MEIYDLLVISFTSITADDTISLMENMSKWRGLTTTYTEYTELVSHTILYTTYTQQKYVWVEMSHFVFIVLTHFAKSLFDKLMLNWIDW